MGAIVARGPASAGMSLPLLATLADEPKADGYEDEDDDGCEHVQQDHDGLDRVYGWQESRIGLP